MNSKIIKVLTDLMQLDIDATYAYEQALKQIDDKTIYKNIDQFLNDHLQHIDELNLMIKKFGGNPPERSKDFKGYIIEGFTAIRSLTGTLGALNAMEGNEKITNNNYKDAIDANPDFPENVVILLKENYADEQRHLNYIQSTLKRLS